MFFIGITIGRALNGFLAMKLSDTQMVRMGQVLIACGVVILFLPLGASVSLAGFVMIGLAAHQSIPASSIPRRTISAQINRRRSLGFKWPARMSEAA